jgi:hypothetical protein
MLIRTVSLGTLDKNLGQVIIKFDDAWRFVWKPEIAS